MTNSVVAETDELILRSWRLEDRNQCEQHCITEAVMKWLEGQQTRAAFEDDVDWFESKEEAFGTTYW
jgi:hypothetical protein